MNNIVAIVGRPNVGKSTLFNRMVGQRQAIVDNISGVTRDRQYGVCDWIGKQFTVIDTGGFVEGSDDVFEKAIRDQVYIAIEEAGVIIFVVDAQAGITDLDQEVSKILRQSNKTVLLVVNKADNVNLLMAANEFWAMGFDNLYAIAATNGSGTGELLDAVCEHIGEPEAIEERVPKFAVIGQPNAGKSTFVNALLGEDRNIVTDIAGTTRDSVHTKYNKFGHEFILIDTAGIRRKARVHENLEFYSVMRAIRALEEADVCLLVVDATMGLEGQDLSIFRLCQKRNKGIVLIINKWDLVEKDNFTMNNYIATIHERISPFTDIPIMFISSLEKQRIFKAVETAMEVYQNREQKITTSELNRYMLEEIEAFPPPSHRGKFIRIKYITQLPTYYPAFAFFCNYPKHVKDSYQQFLENKLREKFNFKGVPISIFFREK